MEPLRVDVLDPDDREVGIGVGGDDLGLGIRLDVVPLVGDLDIALDEHALAAIDDVVRGRDVDESSGPSIMKPAPVPVGVDTRTIADSIRAAAATAQRRERDDRRARAPQRRRRRQRPAHATLRRRREVRRAAARTAASRPASVDCRRHRRRWRRRGRSAGGGGNAASALATSRIGVPRVSPAFSSDASGETEPSASFFAISARMYGPVLVAGGLDDEVVVLVHAARTQRPRRPSHGMFVGDRQGAGRHPRRGDRRGARALARPARARRSRSRGGVRARRRRGRPRRRRSAALALPDLYLVTAVLAGDRAALVAFERLVRDETTRAVAKLGANAAAPEDVIQELLLKLLVPRRQAGEAHRVRRPRRAARVDPRRRRAHRDQPRAGASRSSRVEDDALAAIADDADDQALAFLKSSYRAEFKRAFADAFGELPQARAHVVAPSSHRSAHDRRDRCVLLGVARDRRTPPRGGALAARRRHAAAARRDARHLARPSSAS